MKVKLITITENHQEQRLDNFLFNQLNGVPRSFIYRIVRTGGVRVNKGRKKPEYKLQVHDQVRIPPVRLPKSPEVPLVSKKLQQLLQAAVLYDSRGLLIINKPSGLAVHGGSGIKLGLIESLRQIYPNGQFLELVHRLDRDTSGCVMIAKQRSTLRQLHKMLCDGNIDKRYQTLVVGNWPSKCLQVNAPLHNHVLKSGERMVQVAETGKWSLTRYRLLSKLTGSTGDFSLLEARPITGRTHQIRVHCQYAGHVIAGDAKYGNKQVNQSLRQAGLQRLFLHASMLRLEDPSSGQNIKIRAPMDDQLLGMVRRFESNTIDLTNTDEMLHGSVSP